MALEINMPDNGYLDTSEPELAEHVQYLSDTHLLALLELGLDEVLRDKASDKYAENPCAFLATWLMRNNPRHSAQGKDLLDRFAETIGARAPLPDLADLEDRQQQQAALKLQSASRGHAARLMAGEIKQGKAAVAVQSAARGRAVRRAREIEQQEVAATKMQAIHRGRQVRSAPPGGRGGGAEEPAAAPVAEVTIQYDYAEDQYAAAVRVQAIQRGRIVRSPRNSPRDTY